MNTQKKIFSVSSQNPLELHKGILPLRMASERKLRCYMVRTKINNILTAVLISFFNIHYSLQ